MCEIYKNLDLEDLDGEIWKEIDGYDGDYFVSNFGRVKSFKNKKDRILKQNINKYGYSTVNLHKNGKKYKGIHVIMYETFIGKIPEGCVIHHKDGTKNDFLENFQMMTKSEHHRLHNSGKIMSEVTKNKINIIKKEKFKNGEYKKLIGEKNPMYGVHKCGENSTNHKLTEKDVIEIFNYLDEGILLQKEIAKIFVVSTMTISDIKLRKKWKHIKRS